MAGARSRSTRDEDDLAGDRAGLGEPDRVGDLFQRHADGADPRHTRDTAAKLVEEANLFIDAAHKAHAKIQASLNVLNVPAPQPA